MGKLRKIQDTHTPRVLCVHNFGDEPQAARSLTSLGWKTQSFDGQKKEKENSAVSRNQKKKRREIDEVTNVNQAIDCKVRWYLALIVVAGSTDMI